MIEKIIDVCARNKYLVLLLTGVAVAGAVYSMKHVPLDAIPGSVRHAGHRLFTLGS